MTLNAACWNSSWRPLRQWKKAWRPFPCTPTFAYSKQSSSLCGKTTISSGSTVTWPWSAVTSNATSSIFSRCHKRSRPSLMPQSTLVTSWWLMPSSCICLSGCEVYMYMKDFQSFFSASSILRRMQSIPLLKYWIACCDPSGFPRVSYAVSWIVMMSSLYLSWYHSVKSVPLYALTNFIFRMDWPLATQGSWR